MKGAGRITHRRYVGRQNTFSGNMAGRLQTRGQARVHRLHSRFEVLLLESHFAGRLAINCSGAGDRALRPACQAGPLTRRCEAVRGARKLNQDTNLAAVQSHWASSAEHAIQICKMVGGRGLCSQSVFAVIILVARGADARGTDAALFATGRVAFLRFRAAYAGGALTTLFGATFLPLEQRGREFWACLYGRALCSSRPGRLALLDRRSAATRRIHPFQNCCGFYYSSRTFLLGKSARTAWSEGWRLERPIH